MPIQRHRRGCWLALLISHGCDPTDSGIEYALENAFMDRTQEVHAKQQNVGVSVALLKHGSSINDHQIGRAAPDHSIKVSDATRMLGFGLRIKKGLNLIRKTN